MENTRTKYTGSFHPEIEAKLNAARIMLGLESNEHVIGQALSLYFLLMGKRAEGQHIGHWYTDEDGTLCLTELVHFVLKTDESVR